MAIVILPQRREPECMIDHSKTGLMRDNTHSVYEHIRPAEELNRYARTHQKKIQHEETGLMPMGCSRIYGNLLNISIPVGSGLLSSDASHALYSPWCDRCAGLKANRTAMDLRIGGSENRERGETDSEAGQIGLIGGN